MSVRSISGQLAWARVWSRAVVEPAWRRSVGVWAGTFLVGGLVFGPTAMHPRDVTQLAWREPWFGALLATTWLLVFLPIGRIVVRGDAARFLRSLPAWRFVHVALVASSLVALQIPWLLLWVGGERAAGAAFVAIETCVIAALASIPAPRPRSAAPRWRTAGQALRGTLFRALPRRAGDAMLRGTGFAVLAGLAAGLFVRNNRLADDGAAVVAGCVLAVAMLPAQLGGVLALAEASRQSRWVARSAGLTSRTRALALAAVLGAWTSALAIVGVACSFALTASSAAGTTARIGATALVIAISTSLALARVVIDREDHPQLPTRVVVASVVFAAVCIATLTLMRTPAAWLALPVTGGCMLATVRG